MVDMEEWIIPERNKALVHAAIGIRAGWRHEETGKKGIIHFLEHTVFLGNREHPSPNVEAADYSVRFGGMTEPEQTLFWFTSAKEDSSNLFRLFLSLIFHPEFNKDKIEKERKEKIVPAVVHESDFTPWELANEWAKNLTFNWDFMLSLGKEKDVRSLTRQDLMFWHRKYTRH
jgi:predicted Zn-dependent peptidase